ncbi:MAG: hypothetical protein H7317_18990 [Pseudorhodobacter sp.]|nr:hypothetical protein [Pseudorhodobacter sp.]
MLTVYSFSDIDVLSIPGVYGAQVGFMSVMDGTYGFMVVPYTVLPGHFITTPASISAQQVTAFGQLAKPVPLKLLGGPDLTQFEVGQLANGNFVEFSGGYVNGNGYHGYLQIFGPDGSAKGPLIDLIQGYSNEQHFSLVTLANGNFITSWQFSESGPKSTGWNAMVEVFSAKGAVLNGPIALGGTGNQIAPQIAKLSESAIVDVWIDIGSEGLFEQSHSASLRGQVLDANGVATTGVFTLLAPTDGIEKTYSVAGLTNGNFTVTWLLKQSDDVAGTVTQTLFAQVFHADGTSASAQQQVDRFVYSASGYSNLNGPHTIGLADGRFAVSWNVQDQDADSNIAYSGLLQIFEANGTAASIVYSLGENNGDVKNLSVVALPDGRFAASWSDGFGQRHETQILDARDHGIQLSGNGLDNQYVGTNFADSIFGAAGDDTLFGKAGNDVLTGGTGNDMLLGGFGTDKLIGNDGDDYLSGFDGNDRLVGGRGADLELGGKGRDVFVFAPGDGADRIKGFTDGADHIDLSAYGFGHAPAALRHFAEVAGGVQFTDGADTILITGLAFADLSGTDLIL